MTTSTGTDIVSVKSELVTIAERLGALTPHNVLDHARDPASPLHSHFEWDDGEAAEKFRLLQAGMLIRQCRVKVIAPDGATTRTVRAFVSLPSDRMSHSGYRSIEGVLAVADRRSELLAMALAELTAFKRKYELLTELSDVFASIDRTLEIRG